MKDFNGRLRKNKGITLVALVVTVLLLLIIAGVTLNMVMGENGILKQSKDEVNKYEGAAQSEKSDMDKAADRIRNRTSGDVIKGDVVEEDPEPEWDEDKGVNKPNVTNDMIPIYWDSSNNEIITTKEDPNWYNYDENKWANAKTSDGSYWVWIPRFAYKITSGYHTETAGTIDIIFLQGDTNRPDPNVKTKINASGYSTTGTNTSNAYFVHPSFQNGSSTGYQNGEWDNELTGIWVAKFEASKSDATSSSVGGTFTTTITIRPNVKSYISIQPKNIYTNCLSAFSDKNSHMMKNSEWGAVAYLTHSKYGRNGVEVKINDNANTLTGGGNFKSNILQSSTGNIHGIYDLSGGSYELTSGYVTNGITYLSYADSYAYPIAEENPVTRSTKYATAYGYDSSYENFSNNFNKNVERYGDAVYETSAGKFDYEKSWFNDQSFFPYSSGPFFSRGGVHTNGVLAGVFNFSSGAGSNTYTSFRIVLAF